MTVDIAAIVTGSYRKQPRMTDRDSSATVRFSTADLPENMRVATWREHYGHTVLRAEIDPGDDASFDATCFRVSCPDCNWCRESLRPPESYERAR